LAFDANVKVFCGWWRVFVLNWWWLQPLAVVFAPISSDEILKLTILILLNKYKLEKY